MTRRFGPQVLDEPVYRSMSLWMLQMDPPDHTRLRGLVVKAFTARRVEAMRPRIQAIVDQTLNRVELRGEMDLIADFALRLPVAVICDMLGIPEEDHEMIFSGARGGGRLLDPVPLSRAPRLIRRTATTWQRRPTSAACSSCAAGSRATISPRSWCKPRRRGTSLRTRN